MAILGDGDAARRTARRSTRPSSTSRARGGCSARRPRSPRSIRAPGARRDRPHDLGRRRVDEVPGQALQRSGEARRRAPRRAGRPSATFLAPLPVSRLWGVGPATLRKLERMGVRTIGDVAALDEPVLDRRPRCELGAHLHALARNDDPRAIVVDRAAKSIGAEETFAKRPHDRDECERELVRLADRACARVRHSELVARTLTLKIRFGDFETRTRARTFPEADRCQHGRPRGRTRAPRRVRRRRAACACSAFAVAARRRAR